METAAVILAAGKGTRMKSKLPKVAHEILGKPLLGWVLDSAREAGVDREVVVVGHGAEVVSQIVGERAGTVMQEELLGTADAVRCALESDLLAGFSGNVLVLSGDCPLISPTTLESLVSVREEAGAGACVLTMELDEPFGYGRIMRDAGSPDQVARIVEQKDASEDEAKVRECNSGFYCFDADALRSAIHRVGSDNAQGEFYLTDVAALMREEGLPVVAVQTDDETECLGVNSRRQLAEASAIMQRRINEGLMDEGVTLVAPELAWIGPDVRIGQDCVISPMVELLGETRIGEGSKILQNTRIEDSAIGEGSVVGPNTRLKDTEVGSGCAMDETVSYEAKLENGATTGPRAYLRPGAHLLEGAKAGTHVEIKKSTIGKGSKVPHLSYIGDTTMGEGVNIGAGSITCNYDGTHKHATKIGDGVFVGSDTMMVAPVEIGDGAVIGAGSVVTREIPANSLAVARAREKIYEGWAEVRRKGK